MHSFSRMIRSRLLLAGLCAPLAVSFMLAQTSVRSVKVLGSKDAVEIEVQASDRIVPQTLVLTGPDRLVIDFANAVPSSELRSQSVDRGQVKSLRIGLFQSKPPITRVVVDLKSAQSYQVFPYGRTVMIKVTGGGADVSAGAGNYPSQPATRPSLVTANYTSSAEPIGVVPAEEPPPLDVTYRNGLLGIRANKATLSEVLYAVQQRTGAEVSIAAGAEQEKVVADIAPGPAPEVLARLLNGSRFNFLILSAVDNPQRLDRVILSARADGAFMPLAPVQAQNADDSEDREPSVTNLQPGNRGSAPTPVPQPPDGNAPADENTPNQ
jgi:antitoxin (DNA-binding transcriptional repressor) of toxin-antitoxin stability system